MKTEANEIRSNGLDFPRQMEGIDLFRIMPIIYHLITKSGHLIQWAIQTQQIESKIKIFDQKVEEETWFFVEMH